jgi:hypothetical protein
MPDEGVSSKSRMLLWIALVIGGVLLIILPAVLMPQEIIHHATLAESNDHQTVATVVIEPGKYEVWMSENFWSFFNLDYPFIAVNRTSGGSVHVYTVIDGKDRKFEGTKCRQFARFTIDDKDEYDISVHAGVVSLALPVVNEVYVVEARPAAYGIMQWSGAILLIVGLSVISWIYLRKVFSQVDKGLKDSQPRPATPYYPPPPGYQGYPQYQQPGYQQYPGYGPPPGYPPPPPQQPPPQQPPPQQSPPQRPPTG